MDIEDYERELEQVKSHIAVSEAASKARAILLVLEGRGVTVPDEIRERITSCTDTERLDRWIRRAGIIDIAEDLVSVPREKRDGLFSRRHNGRLRWHSDFARQHLSNGKVHGLVRGHRRGKARGLAKGVLIIMDARGLDVSHALRERLLNCTNHEQLERWVERVRFIDAAEELFKVDLQKAVTPRLVRPRPRNWREDHAEGHWCEGLWTGLSSGLWRGELGGMQTVLFRLLWARDLRPPDPDTQRIHGCRDQAELERWIRRAVFIDDAEQLVT
ncbi:hypothetical protein [Actinomadura spongiicola]|uniref:hypothetical protein n=1 Tax=Actinomadura spongiicola TaxID=2303421 RepID=UPI0018F21816|nr:hypothetical protein [Actinomadura spongiicola]